MHKYNKSKKSDEKLWQSATNLAKENKWSLAVELYDQLLTRNPNNVSILFQAALCNSQNGDYNKAYFLMEKAFNHNENNPSTSNFIYNHNTITFPENNKYNVQTYWQLLTENKEAYTQRLQLYETPNSIHKLINHSARIIYLYELYYRNQEELDLDTKSNLNTKQTFFNFFLTLSKNINPILYYKIEDTVFQKINIPVKTFINAFLGAFMNPIKLDTAYKVGALNGTRIFLALQALQLLEVSDNMTIYNTRHEEFLRMILPDKFVRGGNKKTRKRNKNKNKKRNKRKSQKKSNRKKI